MKRILAISLLFITLFSQTELHQLLKLPMMFEHFTEHRAKKHDLSIVEFLIIHYVHPNQNDADHEKDMKLPFKSTDCIQNSLLTVFVPTHYTIEFTAAVVSSIQAGSAIADWIPSIHVADIWQPPKIA